MKQTYLLTNLITGDEYIGVTGDRLGLKQRCAHHKCRAKKGTHNHLPLYANINQYGWENFTCRVLCESDDEKYLVWLMRPTLNQLWKDDWTTPDETRQKISEGVGKPVLCVETGDIFPSATEAGLSLGKPKGFSAISNCLHGKSQTAYGFHWEYA
ncbi:hypothetical protein [Synechococcus phage S-N03]|uniref:GIY-YIG domain-containing protein n=1 Tax=Synechococcus phage S-N03 TaxID=2718943 RepID=A0A6G8R640_9CAUD|nr:homing endonuclease [Synechococcus phage S-N03]QIN96852.1 hypothetical protein [Synechococcus phage S-N03]